MTKRGLSNGAVNITQPSALMFGLVACWDSRVTTHSVGFVVHSCSLSHTLGYWAP